MSQFNKQMQSSLIIKYYNFAKEKPIMVQETL